MDISIITDRPNRYLQSNPHLEYIPKHRVQYLLVKAQDLHIEKVLVTKLTSLCKLIDNRDTLSVSCKYPSKGKYGRLSPKHPSLTTIDRKARNTLIWDLYYDLDIVNAHPSILVSILDRCQQPPSYRFWKEYVENRQQILDGLDNEYRQFLGEGETWKTRIVSILYGSGDVHNIPFLINLRSEVMGIYDYLRVRQGEMFRRSVYQGTRVLDERIDNIMGRFMCLYLQNYELDIVDGIVRQFFQLDGYMSYEYDGCKIWKQRVDEEMGGVDSLLERINEEVGRTYQYVRLENKPMTERYEITPEQLQEVRESVFDISTDDKMVDAIEKAIGDNIVFKDRESWVFTGKKWEYNSKTCHYLIVNMSRIVSEYVGKYITMDSPLYDTIEEDLRRLEMTDRKNRIYIACVSRFQKRHIEFDRFPHLLGFDNGVYDLLKGEFREYQFSDFITKSVGYNYVAPDKIKISVVDGKDENGVDIIKILTYEDKKKEMEEILRKIHMEPDILKLYLEVLCSCLVGNKQSLFFFFTAKGRNGKSMLDELMLETLGDYAVKVLPSLVTKEFSSGPNPEMSKIHLKRFIYMEEPNENKKMLNSNIKSLTGSNGFNARGLYEGDDTKINHGTYVMEVNKIPQLMETPQIAEAERIVLIPFKSHFGKENTVDDYEKRSFIQNRKYVDDPTWKRDMKMTFLHILFEKYEIWKEGNYEFSICPSVKEASHIYLMKSNPFECMEYHLFKSFNVYEKCDCREKGLVDERGMERCEHSISWNDLIFHIKDPDNIAYQSLTYIQKREVGVAERFFKYLQDVKDYEFENTEGGIYNRYTLKRFKIAVSQATNANEPLPL